MKQAAQKIHSTTQKFTEIVDIVDDVVVLENGNACMVIEVTASNFALLSKREQDGKIYSYAALLNSLSHPIQIVIRNKRVDISSYLKTLDEQQRQTQNPLLANHIKLYRDFVQQMVRVNVVLNKMFYIIIPYTSLEAGIGAVATSKKKGDAAKQVLVEQAKKTLEVKAESLLGQLRKLAVAAKVLGQEELIKLFYDIYNQDTISSDVYDSVSSPFVKSSLSQ